jgi:hypothetical protein
LYLHWRNAFPSRSERLSIIYSWSGESRTYYKSSKIGCNSYWKLIIPLVFRAILLMWHAPSRIFWLIGVPFIIYLADFFVGIFVRTHLIENVHFERYGENGVAVSNLYSVLAASLLICNTGFPLVLLFCLSSSSYILRTPKDSLDPRHRMCTLCVHGFRSGWVPTARPLNNATQSNVMITKKTIEPFNLISHFLYF